MQSSNGDFADSLAVFAAPKRIGLKSHIRLSGVLVKSSSITSSDVSTYLRQRLNKPRGWIFAGTPFSAISRSNWSSIKKHTHENNHRPTPTYGVRHLILISSDN